MQAYSDRIKLPSNDRRIAIDLVTFEAGATHKELGNFTKNSSADSTHILYKIP